MSKDDDWGMDSKPPERTEKESRDLHVRAFAFPSQQLGPELYPLEVRIRRDGCPVERASVTQPEGPFLGRIVAR